MSIITTWDKGLVVIRDREAGNIIDSFRTMDDAKKALAEYEEQDKKEWTYEENFYEIATPLMDKLKEEIEEAWPAKHEVKKIVNLCGSTITINGEEIPSWPRFLPLRGQRPEDKMYKWNRLFRFNQMDESELPPKEEWTIYVVGWLGVSVAKFYGREDFYQCLSFTWWEDWVLIWF